MKKVGIIVLSLVFTCAIHSRSPKTKQSALKQSALSTKEKKKILKAVRNAIAQRCAADRSMHSTPLKSLAYLNQKRGAFVTLRKDGQLRGCIGRIVPDKPLYLLLPEVAQSAAFNDPRFAPMQCDELDKVNVEVSILTEPRSVSSYRDIVIGKHGIILSRNGKSAVFLPKVPIEQKWNREQTLTALARKAHLQADAWQDPSTKFQVFESIDFGESSH